MALSIDDVDRKLAQAEGLLQDWLSIKPPPFYIERWVSRPRQPEAQTYWIELLTKINPETVALFSEIGAFRASDRVTIGRLNEYGYSQHLKCLHAVEGILTNVLDDRPPSMSPQQEGRVLECLGYALTESTVIWAATVVPQLQLNPKAPPFLHALSVCRKAMQLSLDCDDYYYAHRAAYNVGRIMHEVAMDPQEAISVLNLSFIYCETYLEQNQEPNDPQWWDRRLDLLHRLVELCGQYAPIMLEDYVIFLKSPSVGSVKPKAPTIQYAVESGRRKKVLNWPVPVGLQLKDIYGLIDEGTAILSYTNGRRVTVATLVTGTNVRVKFFDPDSVHLDGWDRFFRPTGMEFEGSLAIGERRGTSTAWDAEQLEALRANPDDCVPLGWQIRQQAVEIVPHGPESWSCATQINTNVLSWSVRWHRTLFDILIRPIERQLEELGIRHLVVSPDGGLSMVPFHLLALENGTFLADKFAVSYMPNLTTLATAVAANTWLSKTPRSILIVEDATGSLPAARKERELIRNLFPHAVVLAKDQVTKANICSAVRDVEVVHFCTHARFDGADLGRSGLLLQKGEWLTLSDIEQLQLREGALVFLSACQTARLKPSSRILSVGIHHSFLGAGAASVICSFWEVNDVSTAVIAFRFYQGLIRERLGKLESLRQAMTWTREADADAIKEIVGADYAPGRQRKRPFSSPYYWGPFALYGAWK